MMLYIIFLLVGVVIGWLVRRYRETRSYRETLDRDAAVRGRGVRVDHATGAATYRFTRSRLGLESQAQGCGPRDPGDESGDAS
jgi:hypothetical protein